MAKKTIKQYIDNNIKDRSKSISIHEYIKQVMDWNKKTIVDIVMDKVKALKIESIIDIYVKDAVARSRNQRISWIFDEYQLRDNKLHKLKKIHKEHEEYYWRLKNSIEKYNKLCWDLEEKKELIRRIEKLER